MVSQQTPSKSSLGISSFLRQTYGSFRESLGITSKPANSTTWVDLGAALRVLQEGSGLIPHLQSAIGVLASCLDVLEAASRNRQEYEELASDLTSLSNLLAQHMGGTRSIRMSDSITNILLSIERQARLIQQKCGRGEGRRLLEARTDEEDLFKAYRRIEVLFRQLQTDASLSALGIVEEQMANTRLEGLTPAKLANYNSKLSIEVSRRTCTEDTRTEVLSGLDDWSHDPEGANVYWMNGMAGTGKTTIACSFSKQLEERKQLAASFFCTRTTAECRDITRIVPTVAYQLARYSIPFQSAVCEALGKDPDIGSKMVQTQFELLFKEPLSKVKGAIPNNLVVVIDALDECDDKSGTKLILDMLFQFAADLPLKFFVTSRPEPEISKRMRSESESTRSVMYLHDIEESVVQADIMRYLKEELASISPSPPEIKQLVQRSGKLFIYAATLVRYIRPSMDPRERLESVLAMTSHSTLMHTEIDKLYAAILTEVFNKPNLESKEIAHMWLVLRTVLCVQEPLSIDALAQLIGLDKNRTLLALQPVESVVQFSQDSGVVSTLHASFPDFMFDATRSGSFCCNATEQHEVLARRCFTIMEDRLRFNICNLESSFIPDADVDGLQERVKEAISPVLFYSCCYWGHHLQQATYSDSLCTNLTNFLSVRLLFWMEVMNLKQGMSLGLETLFKTNSWLRAGTTSPDTRALVNDARDFATNFACNRVSQSTPHIYISLLAFCSISNSVHKLYQRRFRGLINPTGTLVQNRIGTLATWDSHSPVYSLAHSPDDSCVAAGCGDGAVRLYSMHDGAPIGSPLEGHTSYVLSVTYSPDGASLVSGSGDYTIRVWSAHDGTLIAGPLEGHTHAVRAVAYSPDGKYIVSGSDDNTLRIWGAHNYVLVGDPLSGHGGGVNSVACSPDSMRIASGADDNTIRVWSTQDGSLIAGPLEGHTARVWSVAFSPDGLHIVSGSEDNTIRLWTAKDGTLVAGPIEGHTSSIYSVIYSPDGTRIASGSGDRTIRIWSARDGTLIAGPFTGHTNGIESVTYSLDGTRILSGSTDDTIKVWSVQVNSSASTHLLGYTGDVSSVAYSRDGSRIVSTFGDDTMRFWSAQDGATIGDPINGCCNHPGSTTVSPDGAFIVSSYNTNIQILRVQDAMVVVGPFEGHTDKILSVEYSTDGNYIVSASRDKTIRVWSAQNGKLVAGPFGGHDGAVIAAAFSPDNRSIVSCSEDKSIRVWDLPFLGLLEQIGESTSSVTPGSNGVDPRSLLHDWDLQSNGWVMDKAKLRLLFWTPPDMINVLPTPRNAFMITPRGSLRIDFTDILLGENWYECYIGN